MLGYNERNARVVEHPRAPHHKRSLIEAARLMATSQSTPICHPDRKHYAKGLCNSCYRKRRLTLKERRADCHPERPHVARGMCRHCYRAHTRRTRPESTKKARNRRIGLRRAFGLTPSEVDAMIAAQGGRCGICREAFSSEQRGSRPNVDHDHATGRIRGMLCTRCNLGLGFAERFMAQALVWLDPERERVA